MGGFSLQGKQGKLSNYLQPAQISLQPRPKTQMTLADEILHKVKRFMKPVTGRVQHWANDAEQQANMGLLLGGPLATVWHGSPHKFTKFRMDRIGTGEGAQAYGHGLYFADNPKVAKSYQVNFDSAFDQPRILLDRKEVRFNTNTGSYDAGDNALSSFLNTVGEKGGVDQAINSLNKSISGQSVHPMVTQANKEALAAGKQYAKRITYEGKGNLYKVDLPDDQIAKMLDWDKPIKDQKQLLKIMDEAYGDGELALQQMGVSDLSKPGRELVDALGGGYKAEAVSKYLNKQGIPGIKYLDQGSRQGRILPPTKSIYRKWTVGHAGGGADKLFNTEKEAMDYLESLATRNYVVFDEGIPKILEINGNPLSKTQLIKKGKK